MVALDKTGTVTHGAPEVTDFIPVSPPSATAGVSGDGARQRTRVEALPQPLSEALAIAAGIEARSQHPLAQAVLRFARESRVMPVDVQDFRSLTGFGATGRVNGTTAFVGSPELFERPLGRPLGDVGSNVARLQEEGKTVVVVGDERGACALLAVRDNFRPNAAAAIRALHEPRAAGLFLATFIALSMPVRFLLGSLRVSDTRDAGPTPAQWAAAVALPTLPALVASVRSRSRGDCAVAHARPETADLSPPTRC